jgi:hypothetical protein
VIPPAKRSSSSSGSSSGSNSGSSSASTTLLKPGLAKTLLREQMLCMRDNTQSSTYCTFHSICQQQQQQQQSMLPTGMSVSSSMALQNTSTPGHHYQLAR